MLNAASVLNFELGQANVVGGSLNDLVNVGGNLTLAGTLNVTPSSGGTYGAGIYRLFNYGGTLTDQGLSFGSMPAGSTNLLQTTIPGQINLLASQGLTLNVWDGSAGTRNDRIIQGGSGVWTAVATNDNWTTADGIPNAAYSNGSFAVFQAQPAR